MGLHNLNLKRFCQEELSPDASGRRLIEILQRIAMPQIWMTYEELARMLGCTVIEARERVQLECLDRKISRDGEKRAKLSVAMTGIFIEGIKAGTLALDQAVDDLKAVHGLMKQECNGPSRALRALTARR
jgi:hypothetical protein